MFTPRLISLPRGLSARWQLILPFLLAILLAIVTSYDEARADSPMVYSAQGAAISGYDPVAYFTRGRPVPGSASYTIVWKGARWQFSSAENLARFEANPRAYAPQYGGYCAYGLAIGVLSTTQPDAWVVHDGKLYLIHNVRLREVWHKDADGYVTRANLNWPRVLRK